MRKLANKKIIIYLILILILILILVLGVSSTLLFADDGFFIKTAKIIRAEGPKQVIEWLHPIVPIYSLIIFYQFSDNFPLAILNVIATMFLVFLSMRYLKSDLNKVLFLILLFASFDFFVRVRYLAPYPLMFFFIFLSYIFLEKYRECKQKNYLVISGVLLSASPHIYALALIFFPTLIFYLFFFISDRNIKSKIQDLSYFILALMILFLPWFAWHVLIAGTKFYYYPYNYYITNYLPFVNENFWGYERILNLEYFKGFIDTYLLNILPIYLVPFLLNGIFYKNKSIKSLLILTGIPLTIILIAIVSPFSRYLYFMLIPSILICSIYLTELVRRRIDKWIIILLLAILLILISLSVSNTIQKTKPYGYLGSKQYSDFNKFIPFLEERCNIFSRHYYFQNLIKNNSILIAQDINENDVVPFLSGTSQEFLNIANKYNLCYFVLYNDISKWEIDYYRWLEVYFNKSTTHYKNLQNQSIAERLYKGEIYSLYKLKNETLN